MIKTDLMHELEKQSLVKESRVRGEGRGCRCQVRSLSGGSVSKPAHSHFVGGLSHLIIGISEIDNIAKYNIIYFYH